MDIVPEIVHSANITVKVKAPDYPKETEFVTLQALKSWLLDNLPVAYALGYPNPTKFDFKAVVKAASLSVSYKSTHSGTGSNDFNSLQEMKRWLDEHLLIAKKLEYEKGKKK